MNNGSVSNPHNLKKRSIKDYFFEDKKYAFKDTKSQSKPSALISGETKRKSKSCELMLAWSEDDDFKSDEDSSAFARPKNILMKKVNSDIFNGRKRTGFKKTASEEERMQLELAIQLSKKEVQPTISWKSNSECQLLEPIKGRELVNSILLDWLQTIPDAKLSSVSKQPSNVGGKLWAEICFHTINQKSP